MIIAGLLAGTEPGLQLYLFYMNKVILNRISDTIKKTLLTVLLIVSVCTFPACRSAGMKKDQTADAFFTDDMPSCFASEVIISTGTAYGGGTLLDSPSRDDVSYIVSAAHLVRTFGPSSAVFDSSGRILHCEAVWIDEGTDIALLKTGRPDGICGAAVRISDMELPAGITCLNSGHDALVTGFIAGTAGESGTAAEQLNLLVSTEEGMSGNGLYDSNGSYCGMIIGSYDNTRAVGICADTVLSIIGIYEGNKGGEKK